MAATGARAPQSLGAPDSSEIYMLVMGAEGGGIELAVHSMAPGTGFMQVDPDGTNHEGFPAVTPAPIARRSIDRRDVVVVHEHQGAIG